MEIIKRTRTEKAFISAGGIDSKLGLTCYHDFHVVLKKALMESSKKNIVVADSSKFGYISPSYFADLSDIHALITDSKIPEKYRKIITGIGIELIIAE